MTTLTLNRKKLCASKRKTIEIEVEAMLAKQGMIAAIWSIEDVLKIRPDLTRKQAFEVLEEVKDCQDDDVGITWSELEFSARVLFGEAPEIEK